MSSSYVISNNIQNIQGQINLKKGSNPYYGTLSSGKDVITDYDTWPYTRWYRGVPQSYMPMVADRESGWRNPAKGQYIKPIVTKSKNPPHCFQSACSVVYPCSITLLENDIESGSAGTSAYDDTINILLQKNNVNNNK